MNSMRILAVGIIFLCTSLAWVVLGQSMSMRTLQRDGKQSGAVAEGWGPELVQFHPTAWHLSPTGADGRKLVAPVSSEVSVELAFEPRQRGLLRYRTYDTRFEGSYKIANSSPVTQTMYVEFQLPDKDTSYYDFSLTLGDGPASVRTPRDGVITEAVVLPAGESAGLNVAYRVRGTNEWRYEFGGNARVQDFTLTMRADFEEIDFPAGTGSPTARERTDSGWDLRWDYPDVLSAQAIGMAMPALLNAGPVVARIAFFAPVSLLFFFTVMLIVGVVRDDNLHPMNYFFLAAGFFAFHLLMAYLVDVLPLHASFLIATAVSLLLVCGYVHLVTAGRLTRAAFICQFAYLVLFSYSFFFHGLTGLSITIGSVATLALLMLLSARVDWSAKLTKPDRPQGSKPEGDGPPPGSTGPVGPEAGPGAPPAPPSSPPVLGGGGGIKRRPRPSAG